MPAPLLVEEQADSLVERHGSLADSMKEDHFGKEEVQQPMQFQYELSENRETMTAANLNYPDAMSASQIHASNQAAKRQLYPEVSGAQNILNKDQPQSAIQHASHYSEQVEGAFKQQQ